MNILFLDIDGVLNSYWSILENQKNGIDDIHCLIPHKRHVDVLNTIIERYNFYIVLSSTWRIGNTISLLNNFLFMCGVRGEIISSTPDLSDLTRGDEIQKWLDDHDKLIPIRKKEKCNIFTQEWEKDKVERIVILDDDNDMDKLSKFLVLVDSNTGLCDEDVIIVDNIMREQR